METYSSKLQTISNRSAAPMTFAAISNPAIRIVVTPADNGSEKQLTYANNLKFDAMMTIDNTANTLVSKGAIAAKVADWRNRLMVAIDADTDARHLIDTLKDIAKKADKLAVAYNQLP